VSATLSPVPRDDRFLRPVTLPRRSFRKQKRSPGDERSYPIPLWSGLIRAKHRRAIGTAVWTFLWCLDRVTADVDGWGIILGGKPVKDTEIGSQLGIHPNTVSADREKLLKGGYISAKRTPYGFVYRVRNSRKFGVWGKKRSTTSCGSDPQPSVDPDPQDPVETKKTMQLDHAVDVAANSKSLPPSPEDSVWTYLRIGPCGPIPFQELLEFGWKSRNGGPYSRLIGETIDAWEAAEGQKLRQCPDLFRALSKLRRQEQTQPLQAEKKSPRIPTVADCRPKDR
jgi:hypothetical protein